MKLVSTYHMLLRVAALSVACVLVFDSGLVTPLTKELSQNTQNYLANTVGATASVRQTEINTLTTQIAQRDRELDEREAAIQEREIAVGLNEPVERTSSSNLSTYLLSIILFIILVLLVLNYSLDFARERRLMYQKQNEQNA